VPDEKGALTAEEVWAVVLELEPALRRALRRGTPRARWGSLDDMWSEVVLDRAHSILRLWDPAKGSPAAYLLANVRWYAYKWLHRRNGHWQPVAGSTDVSLDDAAVRARAEAPDPLADHVAGVDARDGVEFLLGVLSDADAALVRWHVMEGYTFAEIAAHTGERPRATRERFAAAWARVTADALDAQNEPVHWHGSLVEDGAALSS